VCVCVCVCVRPRGHPVKTFRRQNRRYTRRVADRAGVICDSCEKSFHFTCLDPPMQSVPAGKWLCPTCEVDGADGAGGSSRRARRPTNAPELSPESVFIYIEICVCFPYSLPRPAPSSMLTLPAELLLEVYRKLLAGLVECGDENSSVTSVHIRACAPAALVGLSLDQLARPPWAARVGASTGIDPTMTEAQLAAALHQIKADESQCVTCCLSEDVTSIALPRCGIPVDENTSFKLIGAG
jgi:hypothetical protein